MITKVRKFSAIFNRTMFVCFRGCINFGNASDKYICCKKLVMDFSNDTRCEYLDFDWVFYSTTILTLIFVIAAFSLNIILFKLTLHFGLFHANVRLLLLNLCVGNIVSSVATMIRCGYNFSLLWVSMDTISMSRLQCIGSETVFTVGQIVSLTSMATIGFERCLATVRQDSSDPAKSSYAVKKLCVILWFVGLATVVFYALEIIFLCDPTEKVCYCFVSISATDHVPYISAVLFIAFLSSCIACYIFVYIKNRGSVNISSKTLEHHLQERYQIWNNVATMKMLLPNVVSCSLLYTGLLCSTFYTYSLFWTNRSSNSAQIIMIVIMIISMIGWLQPVLIITCDEKMKSLAIKRYKFLKFVLNCGSSRKRQSGSQLKSSSANRSNSRVITVIPYQLNPDTSNTIIEEMWEKRSMALRLTG